MATLLRPYTTLAEVQRETKNSGSELDDWYEECINLASRYIEERCKRDFWFHDHTTTPYEIKRRNVYADVAVLPFPIITLDEVRVFTDIEDPANANDVWDATEYYFVTGERPIHAEGEWQFGEYPFVGFFRVKGTFGYPLAAGAEITTGGTADTTPPPRLPTNIRRAATMIASALSNENHKEQIGLDGVRVELLETAIPSQVHAMLERFRDQTETQF